MLAHLKSPGDDQWFGLSLYFPIISFQFAKIQEYLATTIILTFLHLFFKLAMPVTFHASQDDDNHHTRFVFRHLLLYVCIYLPPPGVKLSREVGGYLVIGM